MRYLKYLVPLPLFLLLALPVLATKAIVPIVSGRAFINGKDVDLAQSRASAIHLSQAQVHFQGEVTNNTGATLNLTRARASYSYYLPDKEFAFREIVEPGQTKSKTIIANLPEWVLNLKGYYRVTVTLHDDSDAQVLRKDFWVYLGVGSPLTGLPGAAGVATAAVGVVTGVGAVRSPKPPKPGKEGDDKPRRGRRSGVLRGVSTFAMIMALLLLSYVFGLLDLESGLPGFVLFGLAAGISWNALLQLVLLFIGA